MYETYKMRVYTLKFIFHKEFQQWRLLINIFGKVFTKSIFFIIYKFKLFK